MISDVASNFLSVTGLRILSRILDFLLRVYLIRNTLSPIILSELVALDLIMTISLYISKSCFKPSYQQIELQNKNYNIISAMNLMTIGIPITVILASMTCFFQWKR